jgi:hypothetical protein
MNTGLAVAGFIARSRLEKTAIVAEGILGAGKVVRGAGKALTGAGKAWGQGAEAIGQSVTKQLGEAGVKGARTKGKLTSGALKAAPWLAGGYLGYKAFEPEVHSAKQRLGQALRGRVALFKARRRAALPYYHEGRFQ